MYTAQELATRIRNKVKEKGIVQKEMLKSCDLNENSLNQMSDKKGISSFSLAKIADILECSVDYLLGRDEYASNRKSSPSELTENEQRMLDIFSELTQTQQGELIGRASIMSEQNDAEAKKKDRVS